MKESKAMASWVPPTLGYVVFLGTAGVTTALALRTISWQQMVLWVPLAYGAIAIFLVLFRGTSFPLGVGGGWAAATAICASTALVLFFVAISRGEASKVVPVSSAYPAVTLIGAALFLAEAVTAIRIIGTGLVIAGVVLISR